MCCLKEYLKLNYIYQNFLFDNFLCSGYHEMVALAIDNKIYALQWHSADEND